MAPALLELVEDAQDRLVERHARDRVQGDAAQRCRFLRVQEQELLDEQDTDNLLHLLHAVRKRSSPGSWLRRRRRTGRRLKRDLRCGDDRHFDLLVDRDTRVASVADALHRVKVELRIDVEHERLVERRHCLADDFLLEVERRANDGDRVRLEVATKLTGRRMQSDELLQLYWRREQSVAQRTRALTSSAVHYTVVGSEDELHQLRDRPRDDTLRECERRWPQCRSGETNNA